MLQEQWKIMKEDEENYRKFMENDDLEAFDKLDDRLIEKLGKDENPDVVIEEMTVEKEWSFIWLMYVEDVDLSRHCKPSLKGYTSRKIGKWTRYEKNVSLDEAEAGYYYLCGGSYPYKWEDNFHLAWKEKYGESFEYSFNGITIKLKNAERIEFSEDDIDKNQKYADKPEYYTCRNWQFANKIKHELDL